MPPTTTLGPGARLRAARLSQRLSVVEVAERLGVGHQAVRNIEADTRPVTLDKIHEVATAIGVDPHSIDPRLASTRNTRVASSQ